jgi:hypothetical protein
VQVLASDVMTLKGNRRHRQRVAEAMQQADDVVAGSEYLAEQISNLGVDPCRVHVVPSESCTKMRSPRNTDDVQIMSADDDHERRINLNWEESANKIAGVLRAAVARMAPFSVSMRATA